MLRQKAIGNLPSAQQLDLEHTVSWLAAAAGISDPVLVNRPFATPGFHIFTVEEQARNLTHCAPGNAVYDANLDSVFVDTALLDLGAEPFAAIVDASGYSLSLREQLRYLRVLLRFVLLHEFAHRQLHRHTARIFDSPGNGNEGVELEADRYAVRRFSTAYSSASAFGIDVSNEGVDILEMPADSLQARERPFGALLEMAAGLNMMALFQSGSYTPFLGDRTHPPLIVRNLSMVSALLTEPDLSPLLAGRATLVKVMLSREALALNRGMLCLKVQSVGDLVPSPRGWSVLSAGLKALQTYEPSFFERFTAVGRGYEQRSLDKPTGFGKDVDDWWKAVAWTSPSGALFLSTRDGARYEWNEQGFRETTRPKCTDGGIYFKTMTPPLPARDVVMEFQDGGGTDQVAVLSGRNGCLSRPVPTILGELKSRIGIAPIELRLNTVAASGIVYEIWSGAPGGDQRLWGAATVDMRTLRVAETVRVDLPRSLPAGQGQWRLLSIPDGPRHLYIVSLGDTGSSREEPLDWLIWDAQGGATARPIASLPSLIGAAPSARSVLGRPAIGPVGWVPGGKELILTENDSILLFDARHSRLNIVFHPSDEIVRARVSATGQVGLLIQGGNTVYILDTNSQ